MRLRIILCALILACTLVLCPALAEPSILDAYDSPDITIGIPTGTAAMTEAEARFPKANKTYITVNDDGYLAVTNGKINAFAQNTIILKYVCEQNPQLRMLDESFGDTDIAIGISKQRDDLVQPINAFIQNIIDSGVRDDMQERWFTSDSAVMPELSAPDAPAMKLRVGTSGVVVPMSYYGADETLMGFDIELIKRLSAELNADIDISVMNYDALIAGLESGKLDLVVANLNITPERAEHINYSMPYMTSATGLVVKNDESAAQTDYTPGAGSNGDTRFDTVAKLAEWLKGKRVGRYIGASTDDTERMLFAESEEIWLNNYADMSAAIYADKLDCFLCEAPIALDICRSSDGLYTPGTYVSDENYAYAMKPGNDALAEKLNATIRRLWADGTLDNMREKWVTGDKSLAKMPDITLTGENGTIRLAMEASAAPFLYIVDGEMVGYDYELLLRFAQEHGYALEYVPTDWEALPAAIISGKCDIACGCLTTTDEHMEQVMMSDVVYYGGLTLVMSAKYAPEKDGDADEENVFAAAWRSLSASFERTFVRENRWKLILEGLWTTLVISILSALVGTVLGFGVCLMRRSKNRLLSGIAATFIRIMQGMPIVVFLMILYYIVFGDVNPLLVAVVGFALNFAAYVSEMMRTGIEAVDEGQIEAASAIGFTRLRAFMLITFPQAARHFLPVFRGEFISLVKLTSVVGYISIMDLTKMGDIIRSRTYEAFFPLIVTAIIYFLLSWILAQSLSAIEMRIDPKRKKRVVKGVREEELAQ